MVRSARSGRINRAKREIFEVPLNVSELGIRNCVRVSLASLPSAHQHKLQSGNTQLTIFSNVVSKQRPFFRSAIAYLLRLPYPAYTYYSDIKCEQRRSNSSILRIQYLEI